MTCPIFRQKQKHCQWGDAEAYVSEQHNGEVVLEPGENAQFCRTTPFTLLCFAKAVYCVGVLLVRPTEAQAFQVGKHTIRAMILQCQCLLN